MTVDSSTSRGDELRVVRVALGGDLAVEIQEMVSADALVKRALEQPGVDPYARVLWPSSIAAAMELIAHVGRGERVIDLCAGAGLVSLAAARVGARPIALDHDAAALANIARSARAQALEVETLQFDVTSPAPLPDAALMVTADVLYDAVLTRAIAARTLEAVRRGMRVILADPGRVGRVEFDRIVEAEGVELPFHTRRVQHPLESESVSIDVALIGF